MGRGGQIAAAVEFHFFFVQKQAVLILKPNIFLVQPGIFTKTLSAVDWYELKVLPAPEFCTGYRRRYWCER